MTASEHDRPTLSPTWPRERGTMTEKLAGIRVAIGTIGDDIHVVGITILAHSLRNAGAEVVQLGVQTTPEEFVDAVVQEDVDAVFVSSLNGHARHFSERLMLLLKRQGATDVLLYAGGNLAVSAEANWEDTEAFFRDLGFTRAYPPNTHPSVPIADLATDVLSLGGKR